MLCLPFAGVQECPPAGFMEAAQAAAALQDLCVMSGIDMSWPRSPWTSPSDTRRLSAYEEMATTKKGWTETYWGRIDSNLRGKDGNNVRERKERQAFRQQYRCLHVFMSGVLGCRMQMGKSKELFDWTHFPFSFYSFSLFTSCLGGSAMLTAIFPLTCAVCTVLDIEMSQS